MYFDLYLVVSRCFVLFTEGYEADMIMPKKIRKKNVLIFNFIQ